MLDDSELPTNGQEAIDTLQQRTPDPVPFLDKIRDEFRLIDPVIVSTVPLGLVLITLLPRETRLEFAFDYSDPTLLTAFTANYIHLTWPHLLSNLVTYTILIVLGYLLAVSNEKRRRFYGVFGAVLLIFPIPLSYLNVVIPRPGTALGFSGLNMALFGFVLVECAAFVGEHFTDHFDIENAPALFFIVLTYIAATHATSVWGFGVVIVSTVMAVVYSIGFFFAYQPSIRGAKNSLSKQGYFELLLITILCLIVLVSAAFPRNPVTDSGTVNLFIHLMGVSLGYLSVYGWVLIAGSAKPENILFIGS